MQTLWSTGRLPWSMLCDAWRTDNCWSRSASPGWDTTLGSKAKLAGWWRCELDPERLLTGCFNEEARNNQVTSLRGNELPYNDILIFPSLVRFPCHHALISS